jgi:hypothetical protein
MRYRKKFIHFLQILSLILLSGCSIHLPDANNREAENVENTVAVPADIETNTAEQAIKSAAITLSAISTPKPAKEGKQTFFSKRQVCPLCWRRKVYL